MVEIRQENVGVCFPFEQTQGSIRKFFWEQNYLSFSGKTWTVEFVQFLFSNHLVGSIQEWGSTLSHLTSSSIGLNVGSRGIRPEEINMNTNLDFKLSSLVSIKGRTWRILNMHWYQMCISPPTKPETRSTTGMNTCDSVLKSNKILLYRDFFFLWI